MTVAEPTPGNLLDRATAVPPQGQGPRPLHIWAEPRFDFPPFSGTRLLYMIAGTSRMGGKSLCHLLWRTGLMGAPMEYFNFYSTIFQVAARLGVTSLDDYVQRLFEVRTSPNGVFGFEAHFDHLQFMTVANLRFANLAVLYLRRADSVAQAVSYAIAMQTRQWTSLDPEPVQPPSYDFEKIHQAMRHLAWQNAGWKAWMRKENIQPIKLYYEDLVADPQRVVETILQRLGRTPDPACRIDLPSLVRQSDGTDAEWIARFRHDAAARSIRI